MKKIIVIGGGFYGCNLAAALARRGCRIALFESEDGLMLRSSYNNQARLHGGYHYPRDFITAWRSRMHFQKFANDFRPAIIDNFTKLYAIARNGSKVNARQFERFCSSIEAPFSRLSGNRLHLFNNAMIEAVYEVEEYAYDAAILADIMSRRIEEAGVKLHLSTTVTALSQAKTGFIEATTSDGETHSADYVLNCTYAGLGRIEGAGNPATRLKHELVEMPLVRLPQELENISLTVMDGPFFSWMPFPDRKLWTLSHVRYTPVMHWYEETGTPNPYSMLNKLPKSRFAYMKRDIMRYIPAAEGFDYADSLFEIKTVMAAAERTDHRRILLEFSQQLPNMIHILGSKLDNVYDSCEAVLKSLDIN